MLNRLARLIVKPHHTIAPVGSGPGADSQTDPAVHWMLQKRSTLLVEPDTINWS